MDEITDHANLISLLLGEGQRFASQPPTTLAECSVDALDVVGLAAPFPIARWRLDGRTPT
jgi:hypothetical protein